VLFRDDAGNDRALRLGADQGIDKIELFHGHEFENFAANSTVLISRQSLNDLQVLRLRVAKKVEKLGLLCARFHESVEPVPARRSGKATTATSPTSGCARRRAAMAGA